MLERFLSKLSTTLYVQIWENRIKVTDINTGKVFDEKPFLAFETTDKGRDVIAVGNNSSMVTGSNITIINPFSHPRVLIADFTIGEKILQHIFQTLHHKKLIAAAPLVAIHPMEKLEGGLTMIEHRVLLELASGAGARDVSVYTGSQLSIHDFNFEKIKALEDKAEEGKQTTSPTSLNLVIFLAVLGFGLFISPIKELLQIILSYFN
ncbi:MAG: rod shape-determining protein [Methylophagaceae bacterium]